MGPDHSSACLPADPPQRRAYSVHPRVVPNVPKVWRKGLRYGGSGADGMKWESARGWDWRGLGAWGCGGGKRWTAGCGRNGNGD